MNFFYTLIGVAPLFGVCSQEILTYCLKSKQDSLYAQSMLYIFNDAFIEQVHRQALDQGTVLDSLNPNPGRIEYRFITEKETGEMDRWLYQIFSQICFEIEAFPVEALQQVVSSALEFKLKKFKDEELESAQGYFETFIKNLDEQKKIELIRAIDLKRIANEETPFFVHLPEDEPVRFQIRTTEKEKKIIRQVISEMGSKNLLQLLRKRSEMLRLGDQIRHVPPLDFLAVIFTQADLKKQMQVIHKSYFKWSNIVDEVGNNLQKEMKHPFFEEKIRSFAELVGADPVVLQAKAKERDWSGFVQSLL